MNALEEYRSSFTVVLFAATVTLALSYVFLSFMIKRRRCTHPLPPGPRGVPILGYLPFLQPELHSQFTNLAATQGPVFRLQLGGKLCVVVSSASAAREVLCDQDAIFANRDVPAAARVITYGGSDIAWTPYGPVWRMLRKVCTRELLAGSTLDAFYELRRREVRAMVERVARSAREGEAVDVGKEAFVTAMSVMTKMLWGGVGDGGEGAEIVDGEFKALVGGIMALVATPNVSDFFSWLRIFDLQGIEKKMSALRRRFDGIFERIIVARERSHVYESGAGEAAGDFLDVMLRMEEKGSSDGKTPFTRIHTKSILMDMVIAGTDTVASTVEFALAEMMNRPETIHEAQRELDKLIGPGTVVEEHHAMQLPYLSAAIKETLRLNPAAPLLLPHCPSADCVIGGYTVPSGSRVFVNAWAIHHDPDLWEEPFTFKPERFLAGRCSSRQNDLIYIPFGYGRRICVGSALGEKTVSYMLAALLHAFHWQLPEGDSEVDLEEQFGLVLKKKKSLLLRPMLRLSKTELYECP